MHTSFFNAFHAPVGAFATFTCGFPGASGGLGLELARPADQNLFIGLESAETPGVFEALPFFAGAADERARFETPSADAAAAARLVPFARERIRRDFRLATDTWTAGDLTFRVCSPARGVPDPDVASAADLRTALVPAVIAELTVDNSRGTRRRRAFFGYQGSDPYAGMRRLDDTSDGRFVGVGQGRLTALASDTAGVKSGLGFTLESIVAPADEANLVHGLGICGALYLDVEPGALHAARIAICFYRGGIVTAGLECRYFYTRYFDRIEAVAAQALEQWPRYAAEAAEADARLESAPLSADRRVLIAHAVRSYYGSTQLLETPERRPFWVVNEGEYRMMNTFDLTVDQLFFEMRMNPWTVRNVLDMFVRRFSYRDTVHFPHDPTPHPGGLSFTHDMGIANTVSRPGYSTYELFGLSGCFSHMTHEQLVNWICCAAVYAHGARDEAWLTQRMDTLEACLASLLQRDHPDPARRTGIMKLDSARTRSEITTYDSLDASLGQARNNIYLAVKTWAAYVLLERIFAAHGLESAARTAGEQAQRCAATLLRHVAADGHLPAVIDEGNDARIIPVVEGLIFPHQAGCREALCPDGRFGALIQALHRHLEVVLTPGVCVFPDGGWKLSSTNDNSWLSKVFLCQFIARGILGVSHAAQEAAADAAHVGWLTHPDNAYWAFSDQMIAGQAKLSKYYPRGVTSFLWLDE